MQLKNIAILIILSIVLYREYKTVFALHFCYTTAVYNISNSEHLLDRLTLGKDSSTFFKTLSP